MSTALTREFVRFVEVKPASGTRVKAVHALIVGAVTTGTLGALFGVPMALTGMTGIFVAISAFDRSQRSRIRVLSALAVVYTIGVTLGALTSLLPAWLAVVAIAALATVTAFGYHALLSDPPGPMLLIMGICAASYMPTLGVPIPQIILITALSMVIGCTTSIVLQQPRRRAAVERQVESLRTAVSKLEAGLRTDAPQAQDLSRLRDAAFGALFQAQSSLVASLGRGRAPSPRAQPLEDELHALHLRLYRLIAAHRLPWATLDDDAVRDHYLGAPGTPYLVRWALSQSSPPWLAARRTGMAILLAGGVATLLRLDHPYWAQMTAALVLSSAADRITSTVRAEHRVVGTTFGVGLFFGLHLLHPHPVLVAAIVVGCASLTQIVAPRHYATAAMVMTPMPLLMASMHAVAVPIGPLMWSRVIETVIGAASALLVLWGQGRPTAVILVRRQFRRAVVALGDILAQMALDPDQAASLTGRRNLHFEQLAAAKALAMVRPDRPTELEEWGTFEAALSELTFTVLIAARTSDPRAALRWGVMADAMDRFLAELPPVSGNPIDAEAAAQTLHDILTQGRPPQTD
ncbi:MAG: FUSC family protein [Micrococcales bacterium]|nr:FUSC family protein [Micrococcales bacterium]